MRFRSKPVEIEANQFLKRGECPLGVMTRENGEHYVKTADYYDVPVFPGDWIIIEPGSDGTRAYPCKPEIFEQVWEPID